MSGMGLTVAECTQLMGFGKNTLFKYYEDDYRLGPAKANLSVAESLYRMAVGAPAQYDRNGKLLREEIKPDRGAATFFLKVRARWATADRLLVTGHVDHDHVHAGDPNAPVFADLTVLSQEQLRQVGVIAAVIEEAEKADDDAGDAANGRGNADGQARGRAASPSNGSEVGSNGGPSSN